VGGRLASDHVMDSNGEFHSLSLWKMRPARRVFRCPVVERGVLVRTEEREVSCYCVRAHGGPRAYYARSAVYARYLRRRLNQGRVPLSEARFYHAKAYKQKRYSSPCGEVWYFYHNDVLVRRFENVIEADAYELWLADTRALRSPAPSADAEYLAWRAREVLDKNRDDRVYEILSILKGG